MQRRHDINRMKIIESYKGVRHKRGQKVRGQRTKSTDGPRAPLASTSRRSARRWRKKKQRVTRNEHRENTKGYETPNHPYRGERIAESPISSHGTV